MANLARGKLPVESKWKNAKNATNGEITSYDGYKGYTNAEWPTTFTLDFGKKEKIIVIRFLLWDGLGIPNGVNDGRKYQYRLRTSLNKKKWTDHFATPDLGYNGWQVFEFRSPLLARYVQLECIKNSKNSEFHIVEFEVHDSFPEPLNVQMTNYVILDSSDSGRLSMINELFEETSKDFDKKKQRINQDADEIKNLKENLVKKEVEFDEVIKKLELSGRSLNFDHQAKKNINNARIWLVASFVSIGVFIIFICTWMNASNEFSNLALNINVKVGNLNNDYVSNTTLLFEYLRAILLRALLISILIYSTVFCIKNYNASMHNYTVNIHKALSIVSALELIDKPGTPEGKDKLLIQATQAIFSHQISGYSGKEGEMPNPNIITSVFENVNSKAT